MWFHFWQMGLKSHMIQPKCCKCMRGKELHLLNKQKSMNSKCKRPVTQRALFKKRKCNGQQKVAENPVQTYQSDVCALPAVTTLKVRYLFIHRLKCVWFKNKIFTFALLCAFCTITPSIKFDVVWQIENIFHKMLNTATLSDNQSYILIFAIVMQRLYNSEIDLFIPLSVTRNPSLEWT